VIAADESEAIGAWRKDLVTDFETDFVEKVGLVGLLNRGGISRGVDHRDQDEIVIAEANAG
jgi:hypothetical protein